MYNIILYIKKQFSFLDIYIYKKLIKIKKISFY